MNLHGWLAAVFVIVALVGCTQMAASQGQAPYAPYSLTPTGNIHGTGAVDGSGGGSGGEM